MKGFKEEIKEILKIKTFHSKLIAPPFSFNCSSDLRFDFLSSKTYKTSPFRGISEETEDELFVDEFSIFSRGLWGFCLFDCL